MGPIVFLSALFQSAIEESFRTSRKRASFMAREEPFWGDRYPSTDGSSPESRFLSVNNYLRAVMFDLGTK